MAWVGTITYGSTTVNVRSDTGITIDNNWLPTVGSDFSETGIVTENINFVIHGTSKTDIQSKIASLNLAFMNARLRQEKNAGDRVYLNLTPDGYASTYRSEILDGSLQADVSTLQMWKSNKANVAATVVRRNWWEGPETAVPLTNGNGTDNTAGLKIYFCNDGTGAAGSIHHNYATIDGVNDIAGDLPGYGILTVTMAQDTDYLYMTLGPTADMPIHWFDLSGTADATASGGAYYSVASGGVYADSNGLLNLAQNDASNPSGAPLRFIARMGNSDAAKTSVRIIPSVASKFGTYDIMPSVYANLSTFNIVPLGANPVGVIRLETSTYTPAMRQTAYQLLAYITSGNFYVDFVQLSPAQTVRDYYLPAISAQTLYDDTVTDSAYYTYVVSTYTGYGQPKITGSNKILIYPGVDQKMCLIGATWARDNYATVTLKYRPRRSTL